MDQYRKPAPAVQQNQISATNTANKRAGNRVSMRVIVVIIATILLLGILAGGAYLFAGKSVNNLTSSGSSLVGVDSDKYQALFLTNGQVYFGKLEKADKETIKISNIFYLQVEQAVQPKEEANAEQAEQGETQLVKLGEELHGPEDEMFIDRDQVLFWENLKDGGKVVEAIKGYKK